MPSGEKMMNKALEVIDNNKGGDFDHCFSLGMGQNGKTYGGHLIVVII